CSFFFSSRRRHTRSKRDWSSDVCSSDLAGEPVKLRDFQKELIQGAFGPGIRQAVWSMPRGQGKTALAAMLGLAELFVGPPSAERSEERRVGKEGRCMGAGETEGKRGENE